MWHWGLMPSRSLRAWNIKHPNRDYLLTIERQNKSLLLTSFYFIEEVRYFIYICGTREALQASLIPMTLDDKKLF